MQSIPGYPSDTSSLVPACVVRVGGVQVDAAAVSVDRSLPSVMPDQAVSASGITAATGDVVWAEGALSSSRSPNPWGAGVPVPGSAVEVDLGYEGATCRVLTGVIDGASGSVRAGDMGSPLVDAIDRLNQPVTIAPMVSPMPGLGEGTPTRNMNMTPTYFTDRILRACGFYATPPRSAGSVFSAPLMGSTWPELGTLTQSSASGQPTFSTSFATAAWGQAADSADVTWTPNLSLKSGRLDETFQMTFMLGPAKTSGNVVFAVNWGSATIRVASTASRNISAQLISGGTTTVCTLTNTAGLGADTFMLRVNTGGNFTIYANNGATATGTTTLPAAITGSAITSIRLTTPVLTAPIVGGLQVAFSTDQSYAYTRTAQLTPSAHRFGLAAFPAIENRPAIELLKDQSEAELAGIWLDEFGVFHWRNRDILKDAPPVATLTAKHDVIDLQWEYTAASLVSRVDIAHQRPEVDRSSRSTKLAWQGSGESMTSSDVIQEIASPSGNTDWIMVDEALNIAGGPFGDALNRGRLSFAGGVETDGEIERWAQLDNAGFGVSLQKIGLTTYKLTTTAGTPTAGYTIELRVIDEGTTSITWKRWRGEKLPMLRAKAITTWIDEKLTGATTGPVNARVLEHDVKHWIQDATAIADLQTWLASQLNVPSPVLRGLEVVPDPRRQRGDVVLIEDQNNLGVRLKALITGIHDRYTAGPPVVWDQTVDALIISVERPWATLAEHDQVWTQPGDTLALHDSLLAAKTLAQHDAAPLARS